MENGKKVAFTLRGVDLGLDDENDTITSCVVEHADVDLASLKKSKPLTGNALIAKQALDEAIAKHGRKMAAQRTIQLVAMLYKSTCGAPNFLKCVLTALHKKHLS